MEIYIIRDISKRSFINTKEGWEAEVGYMAWRTQDAEDYILETGRLKIISEPNDHNYHSAVNALEEQFAPYTVVRINAEKNEEGFLLGEVLEANITGDPKADILLEKHVNKPETIEDSVIGTLYLDKTDHTYRASAEYKENSGFHSQKFVVQITVSSASEIPTARNIVEKLDALIPDAIDYATQRLDEDIEEPEYMWIRELIVQKNGEYTLRFDYEPEYAHDEGVDIDVFIYGNSETGFKDAKFRSL